MSERASTSAGFRMRSGRHVARRSEDLQLLGDVAGLRAFEVLDEAEVEQLDHVVLATATQHHVLRLHVAVDHPVLVRFAQRRADLPQDVDHAPRRHGPGVRHQLGERHAVEVLHHVIRLALARAPEIVDPDGVRVQQLARDLHFLLEPVHEFVGRHVLLQDLDRGRAFEQRVPRKVDRRHAAFADLALQRVGTEALQAAELPLQAAQRDRRRERGGQRHDDEPGDHREADPEVAQRRERLRRGDLGDDAHVVGRKPAPDADHLAAAIAAVRLAIAPAIGLQPPCRAPRPPSPPPASAVGHQLRASARGPRPGRRRGRAPEPRTPTCRPPIREARRRRSAPRRSATASASGRRPRRRRPLRCRRDAPRRRSSRARDRPPRPSPARRTAARCRCESARETTRPGDAAPRLP